MRSKCEDIIWRVVSSGQMAVLLEASAPKPGNVNRVRSFSDTGFRHFLASASLFNRGLYMSAKAGSLLAQGLIAPTEVNLGAAIEQAAKDVFTGLNRSNTIMGTILLHVPLAAAASASLSTQDCFDPKDIRLYIRKIISSTTVEDTQGVFRGLQYIIDNGQRTKDETAWTDMHTRYDISNPQALENIGRDRVRLQRLFDLSSGVDEISREWAEFFKVTFESTFPYLDKRVDSLANLEEGVVETFVWLLGKRRDGLIVKKAGPIRAEAVRKLAFQIMTRDHPRDTSAHLLEELDQHLRQQGNLLNPGTTADLVSAAVMLKILKLSKRLNSAQNS